MLADAGIKAGVASRGSMRVDVWGLI